MSTATPTAKYALRCRTSLRHVTALLALQVLAPAVAADAAPPQAESPAIAGPDVVVSQIGTVRRVQYLSGDRLLLVEVIPEHEALYYLAPTADCVGDEGGETCTRWLRAHWVAAPF